MNGAAVAYDLQLVYPGIATLSGQPATAFPVGLTRAGLPIGLQAIGPIWRIAPRSILLHCSNVSSVALDVHQATMIKRRSICQRSSA